MIWTTLTDGLAAALRAAGVEEEQAAGARIELAIPRDPAHGDWTSNVAMAMARTLRRPPRALAEALAAGFPRDPGVLEPVEVAGPGFLNFRYAAPFVASLPASIRSAGERFGHHDHAGGAPVMVEYVSANPTGPLNVVNARAAAVGATLVRLLRATGHRAEGEFYVNDAGNQVDLLGASVRARMEGAAPPELGYQGAYVAEIAEQIRGAVSAGAHGEAKGAVDARVREAAIQAMLAWQQRDLSAYGAEFATWFRESALHQGGAVEATLKELEARGMTYRAVRAEVEGADGGRDEHDTPGDGDAPGGEAVWLRTSRFGDDKDRVLVKANGAPTYLLPDIAYHRSKRERGFRVAIDLWGPDHHGYIARMKAALQALGLEPDFLEVLIVQQVNLLAGGQQVKMSKRAGEFVTLRDLIDEVGADAAKFFFLMRGTSSPLDFDLDLAKQQNDENPAFYVQYAHARICSILRFGRERDLEPAAGPARAELAPEETALARLLATFPEVVRGAAAMREPQRVPACLVETAAAFHRFYHQCRVVTEDLERSRERLALVDATRIVLRNGLSLMGVSAPERMERTAEVTT